MGPGVTALNDDVIALYLEQQKPIYHTTVYLGIKHFKRRLKVDYPAMKQSVRNKLVSAYKRRSWMEFQGIAKGRGTFPTHPVYGRSVKVTTTGIKDAQYEIEVKRDNGK